MSIEQVKIDVNEVTMGMFISGLDRPWAQTPFPLQGFYVRDLNDIKRLKTHCNHVFIDVVKGIGPISNNLKAINEHKANKSKLKRTSHRAPVNAPIAPIKVQTNTYRVYEPVKKEIKRAQQLHHKVFGAVTDIMSQVGSGAPTSAIETKRAASEMVDSVLRNPDAFTWLSRVKDVDEHTYAHAVRSAVWAILFGRHIGLEKRDLSTLAMGALLKDVGKTKLDKALLFNTQRNAREQAEYETFVDQGIGILRDMPGVEPRVIAVVKTHRERINGSGFPQHLRGDKIPLLGKIAGIVTHYDEITNPRDALYPLPPSKAVAMLYEVRGVEFQEDLVVEFIRAIGLYPTGTLVALNTGEVGVVVEQNFERRLKPKVMILLDALKQPLATPYVLDMAEDDQKKQALIDSGKKTTDQIQRYEIVQDLEPGTYDIDIAKVRDDYLFKKNKKGLFSFLKRNKNN